MTDATNAKNNNEKGQQNKNQINPALQQRS